MVKARGNYRAGLRLDRRSCTALHNVGQTGVPPIAHDGRATNRGCATDGTRNDCSVGAEARVTATGVSARDANEGPGQAGLRRLFGNGPRPARVVTRLPGLRTSIRLRRNPAHASRFFGTAHDLLSCQAVVGEALNLLVVLACESGHEIRPKKRPRRAVSRNPRRGDWIAPF